MGVGSFVQTIFTGGEWSKFAQGQTGDPLYKTALNVCLNSYPIEEKCVARRPGTRHRAITRRGLPAKLISYNFHEAAPYDMEFSSGALRMHDSLSPVLVEAVGVVSLSPTSPAVLTIEAARDWQTDADVQLTTSDVATTLLVRTLLKRQFKVTRLTSTTFELYDPVTNDPVDASTRSFTGLLVNASRVLDFETPYDGETWQEVQSVQTDDFAVLLQRDTAPRVLTSTPPVDGSPAEFSLGVANIKDGPYLDPVEGSLATPSAVSGIINLSLSFTAYDAARAYSIGDFVTNVGVNYQSIADQNVGNTPASSPAKWEVVSPGAAVGPNGFVATDIGRLIRMFSGGTKWTWGKIVGLSTIGAISPTLSGSANIGIITSDGGLDAIFDGVSSQPVGVCARLSFGSGLSSITGYAGKDYTGASAQVITSAIVYPSSDKGFGGQPSYGVKLTLYASNSLPSSSSDGTIIGQSATFNNGTNGSAPVTITSTSSSSWNYVWVEVLLSALSGNNGVMYLAEVQYFTTGATPGSAVSVQVLGSALASTDPCVWRLGLYSDTTGYPTTGCYHEGRLWLGGAVKNRWDTSMSNDELVFSPTGEAGTVAANNAITYTFNSSDVNSIFWMAPGAQGVVMGTQMGEWLVKQAATTGGISATNVEAHRVTEYGCANVLPARTGLTTVFVHRFGRQIYEFLPDAYSGKFFGSGLAKRAKHMTISGVKEIAYQQELTPILWARLNNGQLRGTTYRRTSLFSSQDPEMNGWHRHTLGSGRNVESICTGPSSDGSLDTLSLITNDVETGVRHVEALTDLFGEEHGLTDAWFVDSGIVPAAAELAGSSVRFHGLHHLNEKKVSVWAMGLDCGDYTVQDGAVLVPFNTSNEFFTKQELMKISAGGPDFGNFHVNVDGGAFVLPCVIGFTYTSRVQLLRPTDSEDGRWGRTGAQTGPATGKIRRLQEFTALLHGAGVKIKFGTLFERLRNALFRKPDAATAFTTRELFSGVHNGTLDDPHSTDGMLCWEIERPYPATILSIGGFGQTQDK